MGEVTTFPVIMEHQTPEELLGSAANICRAEKPVSVTVILEMPGEDKDSSHLTLLNLNAEETRGMTHAQLYWILSRCKQNLLEGNW